MKRFLVLLGMLSCFLGIAACGKEEPEENYLEKEHYSIEGCEIDWAIDEEVALRVYVTAPDYEKGAVTFDFFYNCYKNLVDTEFTISVQVDEVSIVMTREGQEDIVRGVNLDGSEVFDYPDWYNVEWEDMAQWESYLIQLANMNELHKKLIYH